MLDAQAPDVEKVADGDDHIDDEAAVHADGEAEAREREGDLVDAVAERAGPADAEAGLQDGAEGVEDAVDEGQDEDVLVGEGGLGEVGGDHLADAVGVDEADVEDEGDEVVVQDDGLQGEVGDDEHPGGDERDEAEESLVGVFAAGAPGLEHVLRATEEVVSFAV
nr:hypothetical protein CFP56_20639 [Quercus suber]